MGPLVLSQRLGDHVRSEVDEHALERAKARLHLEARGVFLVLKRATNGVLQVVGLNGIALLHGTESFDVDVPHGDDLRDLFELQALVVIFLLLLRLGIEVLLRLLALRETLAVFVAAECCWRAVPFVCVFLCRFLCLRSCVQRAAASVLRRAIVHQA